MHNIAKILEKMKAGLMKQILMVGFNGFLDTGQIEDWKVMEDKLTDGKKMGIELGVNQLR